MCNEVSIIKRLRVVCLAFGIEYSLRALKQSVEFAKSQFPTQDEEWLFEVALKVHMYKYQ